MNKWSKLALLVTLISTFIALGTGLYLTLKKGGSLPKEFDTVVTTQKKQGKELTDLKKDVDKKIDVQNKIIYEYNESIADFDERITDVEVTQAEFMTIITDSQKDKDKTDEKPTETKPEEKPEEKPTETKPEEKPTRPEAVTVTTQEGLHLRTEASETSATMGVLPFGTKLTVIGGPEETGKYNWYKVKTGTGRIGWVAIKYVK